MLGIKDCENRSRAIRHTGPLLIHAGGQPDRAAWNYFVKSSGIRGLPEYCKAALRLSEIRCADYDWYARAMAFGSILGKVNVLGCAKRDGDTFRESSGLVPASPSAWHDQKSFGAYLTEPCLLPAPAPYKGRLCMFEVKDLA